MLSIGKFSKESGLSISTLRRWDKEGSLKPYFVSGKGTRYYSIEQLHSLQNKDISTSTNSAKKTIGYCRVNSNKQKDDLVRQIDNVKSYMIAKGYQFEVISDIGSGINYNNKNLNLLISMIINNEVERIVILYKDRLVRFGFELIENICKQFDVTIEIIDNSEKTEEQELVEDLVQIITVFGDRLNGKRVNKAKQLIKEINSYSGEIL